MEEKVRSCYLLVPLPHPNTVEVLILIRSSQEPLTERSINFQGVKYTATSRKRANTDCQDDKSQPGQKCNHYSIFFNVCYLGVLGDRAGQPAFEIVEQLPDINPLHSRRGCLYILDKEEVHVNQILSVDMPHMYLCKCS